MNYYIYRHIRLDQNIPFYIGYGSVDDSINYECDSEMYVRAYDKANRNNIWKGIVSRTPYKVEVLMEFDNTKDTCQKEVELISLYGRIDLGTGSLANLTIGGDGSPGRIVSEETRKRNSITQTGKVLPERDKRRMSAAKKRLMKKDPAFRDHLQRLAVMGTDTNRVEVIDTKTGVIHKSMGEAAKTLGISREYLRNMLRGRKKNRTSMIIHREAKINFLRFNQ